MSERQSRDARGLLPSPPASHPRRIVPMTLLASLFGLLQTFNGAVTAVASVAVAIFTIVLSCVTARQARLTRDAVNLARQEFIATHRPRVIVRDISEPWFDANKIECAEITMMNVGETRATVTGFDARIVQYGPVQQIAITPNPQPIERLTLAAGERATRVVRSETPLSEQDLFEAPETNIAVFGEIVYVDDNGVERRTGFFRTRPRLGDGHPFAARKDDPREYQD